jgi:glutamate--cysteine ligase
VSRRGREPGLHLAREGRQVSLASWAAQILDSMTGICELLDEGDPLKPYSAALHTQQEKVREPERTASAAMLRELKSTGESFFDLALRISTVHRDYFRSLPGPNEGRLQDFEREARESVAKQAAMEAASTGSFDEYLAGYFARA